jgi:hypothetical protein
MNCPAKRLRTAAEAEHPANRVPLLRLSSALAARFETRYCNEGDLQRLLLAHKLCAPNDDSKGAKNNSNGSFIVAHASLPEGNKKRPRDDRAFLAFGEEMQQLMLKGCSQSGLMKLMSKGCASREFVPLLLKNGLCTREMTFEVRVTLIENAGEWIIITLDDHHATAKDLKEGMERERGIAVSMQELFLYEETWTGTKECGGSGHTEAQEDEAFIPDNFVFDGPCSVLVLVNEALDLVLEGQEFGESNHHHMGVYERLEGKVHNGRGVWMAQSSSSQFGRGIFLYFNGQRWCVGDEEGIKNPEVENIWLKVDSSAESPDQIGDAAIWEYIRQEGDASACWASAPKVRARVCNSVEKYAAAERVEKQSAFRCPHKQLCFVAQLPYGCDQCGKHLGLGSTVHGCRKCNFDLCEACVAVD